jgi:hypothetical protein
VTGTSWRAVSVPTQKSNGDLPRGPGRVTPSPGRGDEAAAHQQANSGGPTYRRASTALIVGTGFVGGASTPDAAKFDILGDVDLAWVGARTGWNAAATGYVNKWDTTFGGLRSYLLATSATRQIQIFWSVDGTAELSLTSDESFPDPGGGTMNPIGLRAALDVDDGGNRVATFYTSSDLGVSWQLLGTKSAVGATSIFNSTAPVAVGVHSLILPGTGYHYQAWVRDSGGALVANPRFIDQAPRHSSFRDDQGNTWTVDASALIGVI